MRQSLHAWGSLSLPLWSDRCRLSLWRSSSPRALPVGLSPAIGRVGVPHNVATGSSSHRLGSSSSPFPNLAIASVPAFEPCGKLIEDPGRAPLTLIAPKGTTVSVTMAPSVASPVDLPFLLQFEAHPGYIILLYCYSSQQSIIYRL